MRVAERAHKDAAATDAKRATDIAALLRRALAVRDPERLTDDCPVCGTPDVLDEAWAAQRAEQATALDEQARGADAGGGGARRGAAPRGRADRRERPRRAPRWPRAPSGRRRPRRDRRPAPRRRDRGAPTAAGRRVAAAAHLRALSARATDELGARGAAWQELSAHVAAWLEQAREVEARATTLKALKDAEKWVKGAAEELRRERFAPISERAIENWRELRQGSAIDLHDITLKKSGATGRADFDVRADGEGANALGVMSQGELLALSSASSCRARRSTSRRSASR